jgi:hypothetical protein
MYNYIFIRSYGNSNNYYYYCYSNNNNNNNNNNYNKIGGGVWRIKWYSFKTINKNYEILLTANMQGGSRLYQFFNDDNNNIIEDKLTEESINTNSLNLYENTKETVILVDQSHQETQLDYGISLLDCFNESNKFLELKIVSCSFYDNLVNLWNVKIPI